MFTWADLVIFAILGLSTLIGVVRGFIVEAMSLLVWALAFWLAFTFGEDVSTLFAGGVDTPSARLFLGYASVFLGALLVGGLLTWALAKLVRSTGLSGTDRLLGLGFGLLRGAALVCVLVLLLGFTPVPGDGWWQQSRLLPGFERGALWMRAWLPDTVAPYLRFGGDAVTPLPAATPLGSPSLTPADASSAPAAALPRPDPAA